jgi:predicted nucleotidyltransferase
MNPLIVRNLPRIQALARTFGIERLEVFGSAVTDAFDPATSDLDFIVTYPADYEFGPWLSRFIELEEQLSAVVGRPVDLVMSEAPALSNVHFRREADKTRTVIYDASEDGAAVGVPVMGTRTARTTTTGSVASAPGPPVYSVRCSPGVEPTTSGIGTSSTVR